MVRNTDGTHGAQTSFVNKKALSAPRENAVLDRVFLSQKGRFWLTHLCSESKGMVLTDSLML